MIHKNKGVCRTFLAVAVVVLFFVVVSGVSAVEKTTGGGIALKNENVRVNINTADSVELIKIPGVGASLADRIIKYREKAGSFKKAEDLMAVRGIGKKKYQKMVPFITIK